MYREGGIEVPSETLGLGVQSAIVIGIFEAFRQRGGEIGTVLIEEPEMYLHPQAQRYFYGLLTELVEREACQIIYSTHSPVFADVTRFEGIRLVRREPGAVTVVGAITTPDDIKFLAERRDAQKMLGFTATHASSFSLEGSSWSRGLAMSSPRVTSLRASDTIWTPRTSRSWHAVGRARSHLWHVSVRHSRFPFGYCKMRTFMLSQPTRRGLSGFGRRTSARRS